MVDIAANLKPSPRGELEITDLNRAYLGMGELVVELIGRGYAWLDTAERRTSLLEASEFVSTLEKRRRLSVACPEEIAYRQGYISSGELEPLGKDLAELLRALHSEYREK